MNVLHIRRRGQLNRCSFGLARRSETPEIKKFIAERIGLIEEHSRNNISPNLVPRSIKQVESSIKDARFRIGRAPDGGIHSMFPIIDCGKEFAEYGLVYVQPAYREQGWGRLGTATTTFWAHVQGKRLFSYVFRCNAPALQGLDNQGWTPPTNFPREMRERADIVAQGRAYEVLEAGPKALAQAAKYIVEVQRTGLIFQHSNPTRTMAIDLRDPIFTNEYYRQYARELVANPHRQS